MGEDDITKLLKRYKASYNRWLNTGERSANSAWADSEADIRSNLPQIVDMTLKWRGK